MTYYKNILLLIILVVSGCSFKSTDSDKKRALLPFEVLPVTQIKVDTSKVDPTWGLPTQKTFHLKTCVKDTNAMKPVAGETFHIRRDKEVKALNPSDSEGCIYWSQPIEFKSLGVKETYVTQTLYLENEKGSLPLKLAFSPWENTITDLRYLTQVSPLTLEEQSSDALMGKGAYSLQPRDFDEGTNLVIDNTEVVWVRNHSKEGKAFFDCNVQLKVHALRKTNQSTITPLPLTQGKVFISLKLLELPRNKPESIQILWQGKETEASIQDGKINLKSHSVSLSQAPSLQSELKLYFEIRSNDPQVGLLPYRGIVALQRFDSVSRTPVNITLVPAEEYWKNAEAPSLISKKSFELRSPLSFRILDKESDFDPNTLTTKVHIEVTACLNDSFTHTMLDGHEFYFALSSKDQWSTSLNTTLGDYIGSGCYKWVGSLDKPVSIYGAQELRRNHFIVYSKTAPYEKIWQSFPLLIDPLRSDDSAITDLGKQEGLRKQTFPLPELNLAQSTFTFSGEKYEVNSHLQFMIAKHYTFEFLPLLNRQETNDRNIRQL